jgi:hypothetical protein
MPRPSVTPWSPFARGYQCTIRRPYQDLEVLPCGDRWSWSVVAIDPATGLFRTSARGVADTLTAAQSAAMDAAARPG